MWQHSVVVLLVRCYCCHNDDPAEVGIRNRADGLIEPVGESGADKLLRQRFGRYLQRVLT